MQVEQLQNCDSPGYDICQFPNKTPEELYRLCQFMPLAVGWNVNGFIKFYSPQLKNEPGCTFYRIKRNVKQLRCPLPPVWCKTDREDVIEFLKMTFGDVTAINDDPVKLLAETSLVDMVIVVSETVELIEGIVEKMQHAIASAQLEEWDILSFVGTGDFNVEELPRVVPIVTDPNGCFAITRLGAIKLLNNQNVAVKTCIPHLAKSENNLLVANNDSYKFFLQNLAHHIQNSDISTFKTWECFGKQGLWIYVPDDHLANTNYDKNLQAALRRFKIEHLRDPMPDFSTKENGTNAIIVRHAGNFAEAGIDLSKFDHILEVGGGFGALANVILTSGYAGTYTIYDFQLMEKVFRHYITKNFNFVHRIEDIMCRPKTLLISTWGISEMPIELACKIVNKSQPSGVYIIAQNVYDQRDNVKTFTQLLGFSPTPYDERSSRFLKV